MFLSYKLVFIFFFFFSSRRRHTRCYRDWSSDVCSSDLPCRPRCGRCRRTSGSPWSCVTCTGSGTRRPPRSSGSRSGPSRAGSSAGGSRSGSGSPSGTTVGEPRRPSQRPNQRKRNVTTTRSSPSVPVHPTHPDPEELAAWQAGDLSGPGDARVEAHVSGCRDCAGLLAAVERGRAALAGLAELAEVEPPAGLHERLAAAIEREAAASTPAGAGDGHRAAAAANGDGLGESASISEPIPLDGRRRGRRSPGGRRRIAVLSTAAALILPVVSAPDGYSGTALQSALVGNPEVRSAYRAAAGAGPRQFSGSGQPGTATPKLDSGGASGGTAKGSGGAGSGSGSGDAGGGTAGAQAQSSLQQSACVTSARAQAGDQGLQPAFFVNPTVYRGRAATVLVTVRLGAPDQADLWAFPLDNCSAQPFAHDPVTVTPP